MAGKDLEGDPAAGAGHLAAGGHRCPLPTEQGTLLASIVGFTELTRASNIISNQIFQPLTVSGVIGALHFLMRFPPTIAGAHLERRNAT